MIYYHFDLIVNIYIYFFFDQSSFYKYLEKSLSTPPCIVDSVSLVRVLSTDPPLRNKKKKHKVYIKDMQYNF